MENVELILKWKMLFGWKIFDGKLFVNIFGLLYLCSFMFFWYLAESLACYAALACGMLSVELRSISVFVCLTALVVYCIQSKFCFCCQLRLRSCGENSFYLYFCALVYLHICVSVYLCILYLCICVFDRAG